MYVTENGTRWENPVENKAKSNPDEGVKKVAELIAGIDICMLTTISDNGHLTSRPMSTQQVEFDGDLYFFSSDDTEKVQDIRRNPRVGVIYSEPAKQEYVTLSGDAEISYDRDKMKELWSPTLKAWFADGLETPGICLIKVNVHQAEYWDSPNGVVATTYALFKSLVAGDHGKIGEHEKVTLA